MTTIGIAADTWSRDKFRQRQEAFEKVRAEYQDEIARIRQGGGVKAIERQLNGKGRLTARERIQRLHDPSTPFTELELYAAYGMYEEYGSSPAAGIITGIIAVEGHNCVVAANDDTVKTSAPVRGAAGVCPAKPRHSLWRARRGRVVALLAGQVTLP